MLGIEFTASQERALRRLVGILDEAGACYQFTGGFAGNLHGSRWPLHDLDVDVARADLPRLAELMRPYTTQPLGLYLDDEFELQLLRGEVDGVAIDISQAEEGYARVGGRRVPLDVTLEHRQRVWVLDLRVWVQPLAELIAYKELLGRSADVADLRTLQARRIELVLSQATADDAPMLSRMIYDGKAHWGYPADWLNAWKDELRISPEQIAAWHVRKASCNGKLVGFFALAPRDGEWWLAELWLVVEQIGQGFGRELFRRAVAIAADLGATRLRIEADPNAEGFYLHMGARRDGERVSTVTGTTRIVPLLVYAIAE